MLTLGNLHSGTMVMLCTKTQSLRKAPCSQSNHCQMAHLFYPSHQDSKEEGKRYPSFSDGYLRCDNVPPSIRPPCYMLSLPLTLPTLSMREPEKARCPNMQTPPLAVTTLNPPPITNTLISVPMVGVASDAIANRRSVSEPPATPSSPGPPITAI